MASRSARNIENRKKKARRAIARPKQTRSQGNTVGARVRLRKLALQKAGRAGVEATAAQ